MSLRRTGLIAVEELGPAHALEVSSHPVRDSVKLVPRPGGAAVTLAVDALRALDKFAWSRAADVQKREPEKRAILWLRSAEVKNVYVSNANWLDATQFELLDEIADHCLVWLLYEGKIDELGAKRGSLRIASKRTLLENLDLTLEIGGNPAESDWSNFPSIPGEEALRFRGRCTQVLDADQLRQVDHAMLVGAAAMHEIIAKGGTAKAINELLSAQGICDWAAISMIFGAQLAALRCGWKFMFDRGAFEASRSCSSSLEDWETRILQSAYDPFTPFLYLCARLAPLDSRQVAQLNCSDVSRGGTAVDLHGKAMTLDKRVAAIGRAYFEEYVAGREPGAPLFRTGRGTRCSAAVVRTRLSTGCRLMSLNKPNAAYVRSSRARVPPSFTLRPLEIGGNRG